MCEKLSGLNVITQAIKEQADNEIDAILKEAQQKCADLTSEAQMAGDKLKNEILDEAKAAAENMKVSAKLAASHKMAQAILLKKNEILREALEKTKRYIYSLEGDAYQKLFINLLVKFADKNKKGEILLSPKDKQALTDDMKKAISEYNLTVADDTVDINGGFILRYGKIEENCSVDAIFDDKTEMITDFFNKKLFC